MLAKAANDQGMTYTRSKGLTTSTPREGSDDEGDDSNYDESEESSQVAEGHVKSFSCGQFGHKSYQTACPNYSPKKSKKAEEDAKKAENDAENTAS